MLSLKKHLQEKIPGIDLQLAKKIIDEYNNFDRISDLKYCQICFCEITKDNFVPYKHEDLNFVCKNHIEYRQVLNTHKVRRDLNIEDKIYFPYDL